MGELIKNIEISNFKSIRHLQLSDCRRVNVFIGYPNVGKSNILEAMSLLGYVKDAYNNTSLPELVRLRKAVELFFDGDVSNGIELFVDRNLRIRLNYLYDNQLDLEIFENTELDSKGDLLLRKNLRLTSNLDGENWRIQAFGDTTSTFDYFNYVKKYQFAESGRAKSGSALKLDSPDGNNLFQVIEHNSGLRKEVVELFKSYNLKLLFDKSNNVMSVIKEFSDDSFYPIPFHQIADTLQRLIFYKAAIQTNKETVLLFEEPESHMFPPYIAQFTSDILHDENNNQYFISTHSPFVLNDFMEDMEKDQLAVFVVGYKKETGETVVNRLTDEDITEIYQYGIDLFFNLEKYLKDAV